jgi:hypothetical protein
MDDLAPEAVYKLVRLGNGGRPCDGLQGCKIFTSAMEAMPKIVHEGKDGRKGVHGCKCGTSAPEAMPKLSHEGKG